MVGFGWRVEGGAWRVARGGWRGDQFRSPASDHSCRSAGPVKGEVQKAPPGRRNHPRLARRAFVFTRENAHHWASRNPIPIRRPCGALNTNLFLGGFLHPLSFILHPSSFILHPSSFILHPSPAPDKPLEKAGKLENIGKTGPKPESAKNRISPQPGGWCVVGRLSEACRGVAPFLPSMSQPRTGRHTVAHGA